MSGVRFDSIETALAGPTSELFWVEYADGKATCGHADSFYAAKIPDEHLVLDVGNNKALANVSLDGSVKHFASYRDCYASDPGLPGVWWHKNFNQSGPFAYAIQIGAAQPNLSQVDWPMRMELLGGIFPLCKRTGAGLEVTLIVYAPISADGKQRPRGVIYGLLLRNVSGETIEGKVILPKSQPKRAEALETYVGLADALEHDDGAVSFKLAPNETLWTPAVIAPVAGEAATAELSERSSLEWLNQTWNYFQDMAGELTMPGDPFPAELFRRMLLTCFNAVAVDERGEMVGANWSGYPATMQTWMKDFYHLAAPLAIHEPELLKQCILWFLNRSVRHKGDKVYEGYRLTGGVSFALANTLAPVALSGLYYTATGDHEFFNAHPEVMAKVTELLDAVFETREDEPYLYPSEWLSDGPSRGDYHTGSNVVAWYCFNAAARIFADIARDTDTAERYRRIAEKTKADLDKWCITDGPLGRQYTEGAFADGSHETHHDGEETDTTLMPFYGYCTYDDEAFQNHARVAMTEHNRWYRPSTRGIKDSTWISEPVPSIDATFPGYMTGLAGVKNAEEMSGPDGAMTIIGQRTDMDGSVWGWPCREGKSGRAYEIDGGMVGKSGWAAGVYACHFVSVILGLSYDAPSRTLRWRPFSPTSDFSWQRFRLGSGRFSVEFARADDQVRCRVENHCDHDVTLELELILAPAATAKSLTIDGRAFDGDVETGTFFDSTTVKLKLSMTAGAGCIVEAKY